MSIEDLLKSVKSSVHDLLLTVYNKRVKYLYIFRGKVIGGKQRGKLLGFPTVNIRLYQKIPEGIYVSLTSIFQSQGQTSSFKRPASIPSITFIGAAETFGEHDYKAETYILDFNENIYNQWISVRLVKKIRENKKFASEIALIEQMKEDVKKAKDFFVIKRELRSKNYELRAKAGDKQ